MSAEPFRQFAFDGVVGLGLDALALDPEFHFFKQLTSSHKGMLPMFGCFLASDSQNSEITFGGYDAERFNSPLQWAKVTQPEQGYWRVGIQSVRVGDKQLDLCAAGGCSAILDTGTSLLGVPKGGMRDLFRATMREVMGVSSTDGIDCRDMAGPPIVFDMGGFELTLEASAYSRPGAAELPNATGAKPGTAPRVVCQSSFLPVDLLEAPVFIFGEPVLQQYYTVYNVDEASVGFAPVRDVGKSV